MKTSEQLRARWGTKGYSRKPIKQRPATTPRPRTFGVDRKQKRQRKNYAKSSRINRTTSAHSSAKTQKHHTTGQARLIAAVGSPKGRAETPWFMRFLHDIIGVPRRRPIGAKGKKSNQPQLPTRPDFRGKKSSPEKWRDDYRIRPTSAQERIDSRRSSTTLIRIEGVKDRPTRKTHCSIGKHFRKATSVIILQ